MTHEQLRMQMLSGIITEGEYKAIINKEIEEEEKASLNESMIGGIVGIGAINQIPPREKTDYETAFEHFLGERYDHSKFDNPNQDPYTMKEGEGELMVDSNMLKSYFNELISLADDMEYTPEMVDELKNLKNTLQGGKISVENALDLMQQTIDITEDDIDAVEALSQAVDNDDAIIDKAREIYGLDEGKKVKESSLYEDNPLEGGPGHMTKHRIGVISTLISDAEKDLIKYKESSFFTPELIEKMKGTIERLKSTLEDLKSQYEEEIKALSNDGMHKNKKIDDQTYRDQMAAIQGGYY
jgi:hypothetical protein